MKKKEPFGDEEPKDVGGRPTKFRPEFIPQAIKLCQLGATDKDLADFFEVDEWTINEWKKTKEGFSHSINLAKEAADNLVERRLFERAIGFEHDSEEIKVVSDGAGMGSSVERVAIRKVYPPDVTAAIFWLKNRRSGKWRDKTEVDTTVTVKDYKVGFEEENDEPEPEQDKKQ